MHTEMSRTQKERETNSLHKVKYLIHLTSESLTLLQMSLSAELDPLSGITFQSLISPRNSHSLQTNTQLQKQTSYCSTVSYCIYTCSTRT